MKTRIFLFLIGNLLIFNLINAQSITNTLGSSGIYTIKDASNNYLTLSQSTGQLNVLGTLRLENTTSSNTGIIFKGVDRFIHNYGAGNTFMGENSGNFTMTGYQNIALGVFSLYSNTTGYENSALGLGSLLSNTTGNRNTAIGSYSLYLNTTGSGNTAVGYQSLQSSTTGFQNTAVGYQSLNFNTTGYYNTALGYQSLLSNTAGGINTAVGWNSLYSNTIGDNNTALGYYSLYSNTAGIQNTALGSGSLFSSTTGNDNTAVGLNSLYSNTTGSFNTALGYQSLTSNSIGSQNTAVGFISLQNSTGNYNTALGFNAGSNVTTGANLTLIGIDANPSSPTINDQITLGNIYVTSLRCAVTTITSLSDRRDKKNIRQLTLGLDFITKLKPRQFNWDKREWYDNNKSDGSKIQKTPTAGFIAQELDSVQTIANAEWMNLVLKDNPEKWEASAGNLLPVMVKAMQELNQKCENLETENSELKNEIESLKEVKEKLTKLEQMQNELIKIVNSKSNNEVQSIKISANK